MSTSKSIIVILFCVFTGTLSFDCPKSTLHPDPKSCANYFECVNGQATRKVCPDGQLYNPETKECVSSDMFTCLITDPPKPVQVHFQCREGGTYPDTTTCENFLKCVGGQLKRQVCPDGQLYNPESKECDSSDLFTCSITDSPKPDDFKCPHKEFYPHPKSCVDFFRCVDGKAKIQICPEGLFYNDVDEKCGTLDKSTCKDSDSHSARYKIVCHFTDFESTGATSTKFTPSQIDPYLCTHINYDVAILDEDSQTITFKNPAVDEGQHKEMMELKERNPSLKVMLSLSGSSLFSKLTANETARKTFSSNAVEFLKKYNFDGLDLNWEHPGCEEGKCEENSSDKKNFATWLQELRVKFDEQEPRLLLSAAVSPLNYYIDISYDVPALASALDIINVMSYDYTHSTNNVTAPNAPLTAVPGMDPSLTVAATMMNWEKKGAPANKLNLGIPVFGVSFTLKNSDCHSFDSPAKGGGRPGPNTKVHGELAYSVICQSLNEGWKKGGNDNQGTFAYSGDQWVGYDDPNTVARKSKFIVDHGYGGAMIFSISKDDFNGGCCGINFPLTSVVNNVLNGKGKPLSDVKCQ